MKILRAVRCYRGRLGLVYVTVRADATPGPAAASFNSGLCGGGVQHEPETIDETPRRINS